MKEPMQIKRTEAMITKEIRAYLKMVPGFYWKQHQGLGSYPGQADIIGVRDGRMIAIEVKTERGDLSDKQVAFLTRIREEGGMAFVVRSVEDVVKILGHDLSHGSKTEASEPTRNT